MLFITDMVVTGNRHKRRMDTVTVSGKGDGCIDANERHRTVAPPNAHAQCASLSCAQQLVDFRHCFLLYFDAPPSSDVTFPNSFYRGGVRSDCASTYFCGRHFPELTGFEQRPRLPE